MRPMATFGLVVAGTLLLGASVAGAAFEATAPEASSATSVPLVALGAVVGCAALAAGVLGRPRGG